MVIFRIEDPNGIYEPATFLLTIQGIYAENYEIGFFPHPNIKSQKKLREHLIDMVNQGLIVTRIALKNKAGNELERWNPNEIYSEDNGQW